MSHFQYTTAPSILQDFFESSEEDVDPLILRERSDRPARILIALSAARAGTAREVRIPANGRSNIVLRRFNGMLHVRSA